MMPLPSKLPTKFIFAGLACLVAVTACGGSTPPAAARSRTAFERYWASQAAEINRLSKDRFFADEIAKAKPLIASMPDDKIGRLQSLGYSPFDAASEECFARDNFRDAGSDWTKYALPPRADDRVRASLKPARARALCANYQFRTVKGSVAQAGREKRILWIAGEEPFGVDEYRGMLNASDGAKLPVNWSLEFAYAIGRIHGDRLPATALAFHLVRLPGATSWEAQAWDGSGSPDHVPLLTAANCSRVALLHYDRKIF